MAQDSNKGSKVPQPSQRPRVPTQDGSYRDKQISNNGVSNTLQPPKRPGAVGKAPGKK